MFSCLAVCAVAEHEPTQTPDLILTPLIEAMDKGGLEKLNSTLNDGGNWPRITSDYFASKMHVAKQKELVALSESILRLLKDRAKALPSADIKLLDSEAFLLFSLGEKLWKADGYRNRAIALICSELATYRCGRIAILTKGEKLGPAQPEIFNVRNSSDMLRLFIWGIPENALLAESGLKEQLKKEPVGGDSWIEILAALRKIKIAGSIVGERYNDAVSLQMKPLGTIISSEDLSSLVLHHGWAHVTHESILPELAMYLKNGGSLETLIKEPANATKFNEVMKNGVYRFSMMPVMHGNVAGCQLTSLIESPGGISMRLFGSDK